MCARSSGSGRKVRVKWGAVGLVYGSGVVESEDGEREPIDRIGLKFRLDINGKW